MEKVKLNNQIVSMRKYVKQAKVHVINKLVKQIKLLQSRKGNEIQIQKAKRKAGRFLEAVTLVKKIKPDDVSKLALSKVKDWNNVLMDKNSPLHDRCIAMLASYKAVQKEVDAFYSANKELVSQISDYIAHWEEKSKLPKDSPKTNKTSSVKKSNENLLLEEPKEQEPVESKKSKLKKSVETKSKANNNYNAVFETSNNDEKVTSNAENFNSNVDVHKVLVVEKSSNNRKLRIRERTENYKNSEETDSNEESQSTRSDNDEEINNNALSSDNDEEINNDALSNDKEEAENTSDEDSNVDKTCISLLKSNSPLKSDITKNKLKAITLLNLNELEGLDEIPVSNSLKNDEYDENSSSEDEMSETIQNKNSDPFFLGHNKDDFNSKILHDSSKDCDIDKGSKDTSHYFKHETKNVKKKNFHQKDDQFKHKKNVQRPFYMKDDSKRFKKNTENSFYRSKCVIKEYNNKFQQGNINKYGKDFKLKNKPFSFHDTSDGKHFKNISKSYGNKEDSSLKHKNSNPCNKGNKSETLHPSWEAKRKQKELLSTSFQGKRVVFEN